MNYNDMKIPGSRYPVSSHDAVEYLVNRTDLIKQFLSMNPKNRVSIISFDGNGYLSKNPPEYSYDKDTAILQDWSHDFNGVRIDVVPNHGTNYEAKEAKADYSYGNKNNLVKSSVLYPYPVVQVYSGVELPSTRGGGTKFIKYSGGALITVTMYYLVRKKEND